MPKATLEFQLPEEISEYELTNQAGQLFSAAWEFSRWLRSEIKHGDHVAEVYDALETVQDTFYVSFGELLDE